MHIRPTWSEMCAWFWDYPPIILIEDSQPFTNKAMTSEDACPQRAFILRGIKLVIIYKVAYISDVLTTWEISLFLVSKCNI